MTIGEELLQIVERLPEHRGRELLDFARFLELREEDAEWMRGVAEQWSAELADTREDIYSLEDGRPIRAAR